MKWEKEIYFIDCKCDVHRLKFINTLPDCDCMALYYTSLGQITKVVDTQYTETCGFRPSEQNIFIDRKEAYDYATSKINKLKKQLDDRIKSYEMRAIGYCISTIDGVKTEHEIDEAGW